jgi:hypothetical protein
MLIYIITVKMQEYIHFFIIYCAWGDGKGKVVSIYNIRACKRNGDMAPLILDLSTSWK